MFKAITAWDDKNQIKIVYKDDTDNRKLKTIKNFNWYFALSLNEFKTIPEDVLNDFYQRRVISKLEKKDKYVKIYAYNNWVVKPFIEYLTANNLHPLEADLSIHKRYLVDNHIEIEDNVDVLFFDIETDDSNQGIEIGRDRILSWAAYDNKGNSFFEAGDEREILKKFLLLLQKYDVYCGWNSDGFDVPYIKARLTKLGLSYEWRAKHHVDLMKRCIKLFSYEMEKIGLTGFSLNKVSKVFLNEEKIEHDEGILEMFQNNFELFKKYNLKDAELLYKLDKKLNLIQVMLQQCVWTGTFLNRFYVGELLDNYMLRESKKQGMYLRSKPDRKIMEELEDVRVTGGYVREPNRGLYDNVAIFDFKSLYPSMMISWNIGQDSLNEELSNIGSEHFEHFLKGRKIEEVDFDEWFKFLMKEKKLLDPNDEYTQTANNNFFDKHIDSFIPTLVKNLLDQRKVFKKELAKCQPGTAKYGDLKGKQSVVKEMANSMFGITADKRSRYFNRHIAEGITMTGQFMNKTISAIFEKLDSPVIYGDTDSVFVPVDNDVNIEKLLKTANDKLTDFILKWFKLKMSIVYLEYDKAYRKMIMLDKKRYTGMMKFLNDQDVNELYSKGTEDVKRNTITFAKQKFIDLVKLITDENKTADEIIQWVEDLRAYVLTTEDLQAEDLQIKTTVSKPTYKYKSKPVHVRLAEKLIKEGKMLEAQEGKNSWGNQISYIIVDNDNKDAILADEFNGNWDRKYYWDVQIFAPLERILSTVWPDIDWEKYDFEKAAKKERKRKLEEKRAEKERLKIEKEEKKRQKQQNLL